jgi:hypothetical protein
MVTVGDGLVTIYIKPDPNRPEDTCHLCHRRVPLTKEHVPPRAAFNDQRRVWERFNPFDSRKASPRAQVLREEWQRGFYVYTLCGGCNSRSGVESAAEYVSFVRRLAEAPRLFEPRSGKRAVRVRADTLLIARQIATMILAIEPRQLGQRYPDFRAFARGLQPVVEPPFRILAFLVPNRPEAGTIASSQYRLDVFRSGYDSQAGEISMFPFGFVYAFELQSKHRPRDLADITHWFTTLSASDRTNAWMETSSCVTVLNSIHGALGNTRYYPQIDFAFARQ